MAKDDLTALDDLNDRLQHLLTALDEGGQRNMLRRVGTDIRRLQTARIARQQNPDGSAFAPRKRKLQPRRTLEAIKFLYPEHGGGQARIVLMKSWQYVGKRLIVGYDTEAGGTRTFVRAKILRYLPLDPGEGNAGAGQLKKPTKKQQAMFKKIRGPRFMKPWVTAEELNVGFSGRVARIAISHQSGLDGHARRLLLGYSSSDRKQILEIATAYIK